MLKKSHSIILLAILLAFIIYYMTEHISDFSIILNISPAFCLWIGILYLGNLIVNGLFFKVMIRDFGIELNFFEYTAISILTAFGNAFIPLRGGLGIRAVYMKSRYGFNYTNSVATIAGTNIIAFNIISILALVTLLVLYVTGAFFSLAVTFVFVLMAFASFYIMLYSPRWYRLIPFSSVRNKLDELMDGWSVIRKSPKNVYLLYLLGLANFLLLSLITWFEFMALNIQDMSGSNVTYPQSFFMSFMSTISLYIGITPASLGIREGLLMLTSTIVKISPSHVLMMSILDRAISFSLLLMLFHVATWHLKVRLRAEAPRHVT